MTPLPVPAGLALPALTTRDLTRDRVGAMMAPFLVISRFTMTGPVFPPHPHAGFSVATYILPDSAIGFWNQDTLGTVNRIAPGSLHWTTAGSGVQHEETVERSGRAAQGFQIWIDHPGALREVAPAALHATAAEMPETVSGGVTRRVVFGRDGAAASPLALPVDAALVDVTAATGAGWAEAVEPGTQAFVWVLSGFVLVDGVRVGADSVLPLRDGAALAAPGGARLLRFGGRPSGEVPVFGGPFVAGNASQLERFQARHRSGSMGRLTAFDQAALDRAFDER